MSGPELLLETSVGPANMQPNNGSHGVHHVVDCTTPDGTRYVAYLGFPDDQSGGFPGQLYSNAPILSRSIDHGKTWSIVWVGPPVQFHKSQVLRDFNNDHDVYVIYWPAYQNPSPPYAWQPEPAHTFNSYPYLYSTRLGKVVKITPQMDVGAGRFWFLDSGNGAANTSHNYPYAKVFSDGEMLIGRWNSSPAAEQIINGTSPNIPAWTQVALIKPDQTVSPAYTIEYGPGIGRVAYNFVVERKAGGYRNYGNRDVTWNELGLPDETGPSPFQNKYAFNEICGAVHFHRSDINPLIKVIASQPQTLIAPSQMPSNTFLELTDVCPDLELDVDYVVYWSRSNGGQYGNWIKKVDKDCNPIAVYSQPQLLDSAGVTKLCQGADNRFYIYQIAGKQIGIRSSTNLLNWDDMTVLTLSGDGIDATSRLWQIDSRSGSRVKQATQVCYFVGGYKEWTVEFSLVPTGVNPAPVPTPIPVPAPTPTPSPTPMSNPATLGKTVLYPTSSDTSIIAKASVISDGDSPVTERGFVCAPNSITNYPQITDNGVVVVKDTNSGIGSFSLALNGLSIGILYAINAYAKNASGVAYATTVQFTLPIVDPRTYEEGLADGKEAVIQAIRNLVK